MSKRDMAEGPLLFAVLVSLIVGFHVFLKWNAESRPRSAKDAVPAARAGKE